MPGTPTGDLATGQSAGAGAKVFVSYAREDQPLAAELVAGLELCGFAAYLDRDDIAPGEPWEERLGGLIRNADTVVFVLSPDAVASGHCRWEVEHAVALAKRLIPVVARAVPDTDVPPRLQRLNYIYFDQGRSFTSSLGSLAQALRVDLDWIREHTRLGEFAARWIERSRPAGLLLHGDEVEDAQRWLARRPPDAPVITSPQQEFLDASRRAAADDRRRRERLQWRAKAGTIAAAIIFAAGTAVSTLAWLQARAAQEALRQRVEDLRAANLRLDRKIALRVAPTGALQFKAGEHWYRIATDYAGAIAIVKGSAGQDRIGSGFIVRGSALHESWGADPVFVTASFVIGKDALAPARASASFPGLEGDTHSIGFDAMLWERPFDDDIGVSVLRIKGPLPFAAKPIERVRTTRFEGLREAAAALPPDAGGSLGRALATVGYGAISSGFALFLHNLSGWTGRDPQGRPLRLRYSHVTEGGAGGAPVFDVETGELVAVHQSGMFAGGPGARVGEGAAMDTVVAAIRADLTR